MKDSFFRGRDALDVAELKPKLALWVREVAGARGQGTTGRRPLDVFEAEEQRALLQLPTKRYPLVVWKEATVHRDSHVEYERRLYLVPWRLMGSTVWLQVTNDSLLVFANDERGYALSSRV